MKIFFLSAHYRSPVDFSFEKMEGAKKARERFYILLDKLKRLKVQRSTLKATKAFQPSDSSLQQEVDSFRKRFEDAMDEDFNTAEALAVLFDLVTHINKKIEKDKAQGSGLRYAKDTLLELGKVLGLFEQGRPAKPADIGMPEDQINNLIDMRSKARQKKDFKAADKIREELDRAGIILEDQKGSTSWRVK